MLIFIDENKAEIASLKSINGNETDIFCGWPKSENFGKHFIGLIDKEI